MRRASGLAVGVWKDLDEIRGQWTLDRAFQPEMDAQTAARKVDGWHKAVTRARDWAESE